MSDFMDLVKSCKKPYLYQRCLNSKKMIPTTKIGQGQIVLMDTKSVVSPQYYWRVSKYPKSKYQVLEQSSMLKGLVSKYIQVNGV